QNGGMKKEVPTNELPSTHKVEAGDTLYSLSRKYQISIEQLKELNGLVSNALSIGQVLKLR
ncbi:MAG: LysM peptidoglycan-binding domain-containing protein, partial [Bacteroidota bacterium]|nr:LysM peptidoglycan-binding domain-containing protein [Bacteroidota bacterium]MDX5431462.1 LysM peptidoglycan-binding domain-containing protein [Bacteroidota bacterium]MDX5470189.1 LysM peptidoglycan-binding domain-containing protein [Bacteroidota bacterium]